VTIRDVDEIAIVLGPSVLQEIVSPKRERPRLRDFLLQISPVNG
jgi:hypothetical protein